MIRDSTTFNEEDDLFDIYECLMENSFRRVPILSEGKLRGLISRRDIIKFILKLRKKGEFTRLSYHSEKSAWRSFPCPG